MPINAPSGDKDISTPTKECIGKDVAIFRRDSDDEWGINRVVSQKQEGGKVGKPKTSNPAFPMSTLSLFHLAALRKSSWLFVRWQKPLPLELSRFGGDDG